MAKSLTVIRNAKVVGRNRASYNDKHPNNPVSLRPLHGVYPCAPRWVRAKLRTMRNWDRPAIARALRILGV